MTQRNRIKGNDVRKPIIFRTGAIRRECRSGLTRLVGITFALYGETIRGVGLVNNEFPLARDFVICDFGTWKSIAGIPDGTFPDASLTVVVGEYLDGSLRKLVEITADKQIGVLPKDSYKQLQTAVFDWLLAKLAKKGSVWA